MILPSVGKGSSLIK